jgi:VWFA-related protein
MRMRPVALLLLLTSVGLAAHASTSLSVVLSASKGQTPPSPPPPAPQPAPPSQTPPATPQPPVTFKVEINYVEIDALVTDAQGNLIRDLKKEDFEVLEDGKPQTLSVFALVDLPVERAEAPLFSGTPIEPDVQSNEREFNGRVYMIVLDDMHTAAQRSNQVKRAARQFIDRYLGANDMAAVIHTSGRGNASQDFTSNKRLLQAAIDKFMGRKLRSAVFDKLDEYNRRRVTGGAPTSERLDDPQDAERGYNARAMLETLQSASDFLAGIRGRRKAMLFISEGVDYNIYDVFNNQSASTILDETREAIGRATRANVSIYSIDPRGLATIGDEAIELTAPPEDPSLRLDTQGLQDELRLSQDSLRVLADETGGFAAVNSNDFAKAFDRVVRENSTYYVLGYYPTNDKRDGRFRKVSVRVKRPGLEVRARRGYAAPKGRPPATTPPKDGSVELREALNSPIPVSGLSLRAFAAAFKGTAPNASVLLSVELDGKDFKFVEGGGLFRDSLELTATAIDQSGKVRDAKPHTLKLDLRPQTHAAVVEHGFRVSTRLQVPPGRYQIRIGGREANGGSVGTVLYDLEVPDYWKAPFAMSGLVMTAASAARMPTANPDTELKDVLPGPPIAIREFPTGDRLVLYTEVYDGEAAKPHGVDITTTLTSNEGRVVFTTSEERKSTELSGPRGGYGYKTEVPLTNVPPGLYVLEVAARSRLGPVAARQVMLQVR